MITADAHHVVLYPHLQDEREYCAVMLRFECDCQRGRRRRTDPCGKTVHLAVGGNHVLKTKTYLIHVFERQPLLAEADAYAELCALNIVGTPEVIIIAALHPVTEEPERTTGKLVYNGLNISYIFSVSQGLVVQLLPPGQLRLRGGSGPDLFNRQ